MHTVYAISSLTRKYIYVGLSSDLETRLMHHNRGYNKTTRAYAPYRLIYSRSFDSRILAREQEKYLKSGIGREFINHINSLT